MKNLFCSLVTDDKVRGTTGYNHSSIGRNSRCVAGKYVKANLLNSYC